MISVYVAGASRNLERSRGFIARVLADPNMQLTHNWVADIDAAQAIGKDGTDFSDDARSKFAETDLEGIAACDVIVFLAEEEPMSRGMWVGLGYAIALRDMEFGNDRDPVHIIVSGGARRSIFTAPPIVNHEVFDDGEAWHLLVGAVESLTSRWC